MSTPPLSSIIRDHDRPEKTIVELKNYFKTEDIDMILINIISGYLLSRDEIKKLWDKIKIYGNLISITEKYLRKRKEMNFGTFFSTLEHLYRPLDLNDFKRIITRVERLKSKTKIPVEDAIHYLETRIGNLDLAPIPNWINIKDGENMSLLTKVDIGSIAAEGIQSGEYKKLMDKATDIFYSFEPSSDGDILVAENISLDIRETVQNYLSSISILPDDGRTDDAKLANRVFGPQNAFIDQHCPYNLNELGPCRMLNCFCRGNGDLVLDAQTDQKEWFDGNCDICNRRIRDKSHALRYPYKNGGWIGVFCSFSCLEESEFFNGIEDFDQYIRMENLGATLVRDGIMDRTKV